MKTYLLFLMLLCGHINAQSVTLSQSGSIVTVHLYTQCALTYNSSYGGYPCYITYGTGTPTSFSPYYTFNLSNCVFDQSGGVANTYYLYIDLNTFPANKCNTLVKVQYSCSGNVNNVYSSTKLKPFVDSNPNLGLSFENVCSGNTPQMSHDFQTNLSSGVEYKWIAVSNTNVLGESTTAQSGNTITDILTNSSMIDQTVNYTVTASMIGEPTLFGCSVSKQKTIYVKPSSPQTPIISVTNGTASFCEGSSITLGVTGNVTPNQSPGGWYNGTTALGNSTSITVSNTGAYIYKNNNGCGVSVSDTIHTIRNLKPTLTSPTNVEICTGESVNYTITSSEPCTYTWIANAPNISGETAIGSGGTISDFLTNNTITNQSIAYQLSLTSQATGCVKNQNLIVLVKPAPLVDPVQDNWVCSGNALNIPLQSNVATASYSWLAQNNTNINGESITQNSSSYVNDTLINNTSTDQLLSYAVNATTECGTSPIENFIVTVRASPQPVILASGPLEFCDGDFVNLSVDQIYSHYSWSNGLSGPNITTISIEQTEDVNVNVIDQYGCTGSSSIVQVIEHPIPAPIINYSNGVLSSNYSTGNQWKLNNQPILGANQNTYSPNTNGNYSLTVTIDGCSGNSSSVYYGSASLSENNPNSFSIHPNPATNQVIISSQFFTENEAVQIFNTAGQLVHEYPNLSPQHQTYTINVEQLNPGIYFIQIGEMTQKLIIE